MSGRNSWMNRALVCTAIVREIFSIIQHLRSTQRYHSLVEQNAHIALQICRGYVLEGCITLRDKPQINDAGWEGVFGIILCLVVTRSANSFVGHCQFIGQNCTLTLIGVFPDLHLTWAIRAITNKARLVRTERFEPR